MGISSFLASFNSRFNFLPTPLLSSLDCRDNHLQGGEPVCCCWWSWCGSHQGSMAMAFVLLRSFPVSIAPLPQLSPQEEHVDARRLEPIWRKKHEQECAPQLPDCFRVALLRNKERKFQKKFFQLRQRGDVWSCDHCM